MNVAVLIDEILMKIAGGDLAIIKLSPGFKKGIDLDSLDRQSMSSLIDNYKSKYGLIQEYSFKSNDINDIINDMGQ